MVAATQLTDWIEVTLKVTESLEELGVPYVICGSFASIIHGIVRTTIDTDLVADLKLSHVKLLVAALESEFFVDEESIIDSINSRTSFNMIHQNTMFKIDVFIPKERPFEHAQLSHRLKIEIAQNPQRAAWIASAEDVVLAKLEWFRIGNEVSERQWRDVLGVLKTQSGKLDVTYMRNTASPLGVSDLLEIALKEAETETE